MKKFAIAGFVAALLVSPAALQAQDFPQLPTPQKEHEWLEQFVGEWESEAEAVFAPGMPPIKCKGTETARKLGGFWIVAESESTPMDMPMSAVMTLGYDTEKKKYVGTWVDSMFNHMWKYEGTVDDAGKVLTLEAEGPNPLTGKLGKFRDVTEFKSKDHKVLTSSMQGEDGEWVTFMTANYRRKK